MQVSKNTLSLATYGVFILLILAAPLYFDVFWLNRFSKFLVFGMLGIAMALCWGYAGILNLGQGLFFGLGAYAIAMSMKLASPTSLAQGSDMPIPDFMLWNAEPGAPIDLCCITSGSFFWIPFKSQFVGVAMSIVIPTAVAFVIGVAFATVVTSLVDDLIMPVIAMIIGKPDFSDLTFTINDAVFRYGAFITQVITFVAIAAAVFFFIVKPVQMMVARGGKEPIEEGMPDEERRHQELLAALRANR